ncbi:ubiquinone anaerobic biosynthesis accessory factor UbiT [Pseudoalteromonas denitrificans]|uniref:Predicted lipid carrier protein YhbT, contains SCP2 domain n=1 Tax=Pseudoalteromonas denitrificans DSM 6059 TaxID=1123010 RepID=A0A1I1E8G5_9GAMM|nr:SCP2 sterol-binding domain-containing protein [Pseudoalteromonas denitrificans]SFB83357.1 Predicted lipid carrier protein YhbT, contains SCP2 domain [Pseudoalteromonas denitrificans DSM 6059]
MTFLKNVIKFAVEKFPQGGKLALKLIPNQVPCFVLERILNKVFIAEIKDQEFDFLIDKWLELTITDLDSSWYISYQNHQGQSRLIIKPHAQSNVVFRGNFNSFVLMASQKADPDTLFFNRELLLTGDTELGLEIKSILENLDRETLPKFSQDLLNWHSNQILSLTEIK